MNRLLPLVAVLVGVGALVFAQESNQGQDLDIFGRPIPEEQKDKLLDSMQGAWQLLDVDDTELPEEDREMSGFLLVSGNFLSIEIHISWEEFDDAFQTGIHEFRLNEAGELLASSMIGSYLDADDELEWERPGLMRRFNVAITGDVLSLTRDDGSRFEFIRRNRRRFFANDFFNDAEDFDPLDDFFDAEEDELEGDEEEDEDY